MSLAAHSEASDSPPRLSDQLVAIGRHHGLSAVGVTDVAPFLDTRADLIARRRTGLHGGMQFTYRNPERSTDPARILPGARALAVGAWGYRRHQPEPVAGADRPMGAVASYAQRDHYESLRCALTAMAERLHADGWRAVVICDDNALVDRAAAHRAGLGWFGKNSLLLLPGLGSWFVLGSVVTDAPLVSKDADPPVPSEHGSGCGSCSRCMTACPTGALVAPGVLDARRCLAWLVQAPGSIPVQFRQAMGDRIYGCDDCQQACPINKVADRRGPPPPSEVDAHAEVDLLALLSADDDELLSSYGRWYIAGRQARYLRRNALVALGNVGNGSDPATAGALERALTDPDPMIVEHAEWAARQLGRADLVGATR